MPAFRLYKDLQGLSYYGYIPIPPEPLDERVEKYQFELEDVAFLLDDFAYKIDCLLDLGDVDYFSGDKLYELKDWLLNRLSMPLDNRGMELYCVLLYYTMRAIELNTGVVIEL